MTATLISSDGVLAKIDRATAFLAEAKSLQEVNAVIAMADAAAVFAKRVKASQQTINAAGEIRLRAERKLGELLKQTQKANGTRGQLKGKQSSGGAKVEPPENSAPTLKELDIERRDSSRAQRLASIPEPEFEQTLARARAGDVSPSRVHTDLARKTKETNRETRREHNRAKIADAAEPADVIATGARFASIVIDPPWDWGDEGDCDQLGRARPTYGTMPIEKIAALPVAELSDDDCHLYLWITNRSLPKGFALLDGWGFRYVTCLTWCKPSIGMGNYFRGSTEQVLFGVKGSQPLKRKDVGTWFKADRGSSGHSSKPVEFFDLVESCSPGPFLEMFSRSKRHGWTAWGAEAG